MISAAVRTKPAMCKGQLPFAQGSPKGYCKISVKMLK